MFGIGIGNFNCFGLCKEIKFIDIMVFYEFLLVIYEGVDNIIVNDDVDVVVVERLEE